MTIKKQYLTTYEIIAIGEDMRKCETHILREVTKWLLICAYCTDVELRTQVDEKTKEKTVILESEIYDELVQNGTIEKLKDTTHGILNHMECDFEYESLMDIKQETIKTLSTITKKIESVDFDKIDIKSMISNVMGIVQNIKK